MIICPSCKEEIDNDSNFCDQCGQELVYCSSCGRVGVGRRCTYCGGLMITAEKLKEEQEAARQQASVSSVSMGFTSMVVTNAGKPVAMGTMPTLMLYNPSLNIRIVGINGAIIGRKQGPYQQMFATNMYISGVHAQLIYQQESGWCIIDKHSSNGTKLNQRDILPDVPMTIKSGDIVTLANVNLQVTIS